MLLAHPSSCLVTRGCFNPAGLHPPDAPRLRHHSTPGSQDLAVPGGKTICFSLEKPLLLTKERLPVPYTAWPGGQLPPPPCRHCPLHAAGNKSPFVPGPESLPPWEPRHNTEPVSLNHWPSTRAGHCSGDQKPRNRSDARTEPAAAPAPNDGVCPRHSH